MSFQDFFIERSPEFISNPYPFYRALLEHDPVWWSSVAQRWLVSGYKEVSDLLRNPRVIVEPVMLDYEHSIPEAVALRTSQRNWLSKNNEPAHSRMRRPFLEASAVESLAYLGEYGQKEAKRLLDIASKKPSFDALYEYSAPFLTSVIAEWCGIPDDERLLFRKQVHFTCSHFSPLIPGQVTPVYSAGEKLLEIIRRQFLLRQQKPGRDFISMVAQSQYEDVTVDELVDNILLAVFASYETTLHLIGTGTYQLIQTPDVLEALRLNPEIIGEIVDEILRMFGSVQLVTRLVSEDFEYSGKKFEKEQQIWLLLAAANRDGRVFDEPDQLYLGRENKKHLSFGSGAHYCIGTYMAKRLASIAITELFERFPNLSLAGTCDFHPSVGIRGLLNLPVSDRSQLDF